MCGIAGVVRFAGDPEIELSLLRRMCAAMVHRGPDDEGIHSQGKVGLAVRRLSIIDLATGHQPLSNEDHTVWIAFNGEIYNHLALREQLIAQGHRYRTHSDTETIVHLYEEYGRDCVNHLRGMFAFAIWDARRRCLFIARDRLGIKPLYYRLTQDCFLFASEIKAILAHPGVRPSFNRGALPEYLAFGYLSGRDTFFSGILKLMPGHTITLEENGETRIDQYWDVPLSNERSQYPESYYIEGYRSLLENAVSSHLISDVPLGIFLSGGIDSGAVAALTTKLTGARVQTFSVGYAEQSWSELPYARKVATHLKSSHHEILVSSDEFFHVLPELIWHEDEPIVWPSSVALYFASRLAREHVTVVLTGEGSDETLAGYTRYAFTLKNAAMDRFYRRLTSERIRRLIREAISDSRLLSAKLRRKLEHMFFACDGGGWTSFYFDNFFSAFSQQDQEELLTDDLLLETGDGAAYRNVMEYWRPSSDDLLQRLLYADVKTYLVELLMKQDNMSMAASVESRVPFLDHPLVEFAMRIPRQFQIKGLRGKHILKKAIADLLPPEIIHRPKLGFPTPWSEWLLGPQIEAVKGIVLAPRSLERGLFKPITLRRLFDEHSAGQRDHSDGIWRLLNLELWFRYCLEGDVHGSGWPCRDSNTLPTSV